MARVGEAVEGEMNKRSVEKIFKKHMCGKRQLGESQVRETLKGLSDERIVEGEKGVKNTV